MTDRRRRERTLPEGYQFGDARRPPHVHTFNAVSGYCACGLKYAPYLAGYFPNGGWLDDDLEQRFVTRLEDGATVADDVLPWRAPHLNAADRLARHAGWNVIEGEQFDSDAERHPVIEGAR